MNLYGLLESIAIDSFDNRETDRTTFLFLIGATLNFATIEYHTNEMVVTQLVDMDEWIEMVNKHHHG
jgi:hypothetical protein